MAFCLPTQTASEFLKGLRDGKIDPIKMAEMSSAERRAVFEKYVGAEDAHFVNAAFEEKLLLKDFKKGLVSWAKKVTGLSTVAKRDLLSRIDKVNHVFSPEEEKAFLQDYVSNKVGATVTLEEAQKIAEFSQKDVALRQNFDAQKGLEIFKKDKSNYDAGWSSTEARLEWGRNHKLYERYINELKGKENPSFIKEFKAHPIGTLGSILKGIQAAFDDSFFGRQARRVLSRNPKKWSSELVQSLKNGAQQLKGKDVMLAIESDIVSRPAAMLGYFDAMKVDVGVKFEEAFPSHLPERVPILGDLYKASEVMFNGSALRLRAWLAEQMIGTAEQAGLNMLDPRDAKGVGYLVNEMTGRGHLGALEPVAGNVNVLVFSLRYLKANIDALTLHQTNMRSIESLATRKFVRKQAAQNLVKVVAQTAVVLGIANLLMPGSAELDPRSANFGKIRIGKTRIDITGGMGAIITLASHVVFSWHNGKFSVWYKSTTTGKWTDLYAGKYGQMTPLDAIINFGEGKLSPIAGVLRDVWKGKVFGGAPATPKNLLYGATTPLPVQTGIELLKNKESAPFLLGMIADALGFSTNTY